MQLSAGDSITVVTDMFEHREVRPHFINPCCFGEDFATWLKQELVRLGDLGFNLSEMVQEDYGWGFWASHGKRSLLARGLVCRGWPSRSARPVGRLSQLRSWT